MSKTIKFTANQTQLIEWLAEPKYTRSPPTQAMLADNLGVRSETITRWKTAELRQAVNARAREMIGDALPDIYGALVSEAEKGSYQHIKLVLEMLGEFTPSQSIDINLKDMSDAELEQIASGKHPYTVTGTGWS